MVKIVKPRETRYMVVEENGFESPMGLNVGLSLDMFNNGKYDI
jgi:hypothetical protein